AGHGLNEGSSGPSGSVHSLTSTVLEPRSSMTRTVVPLGNGSTDQAMNASEPPRILTWTSPGPASPRVATVMTPMQPIAEWFATISRRSSCRHLLAANPGFSAYPCPGCCLRRAQGRNNSPGPLVTVLVGVLCPPGLHHRLRGLPFG